MKHLPKLGLIAVAFLLVSTSIAFSLTYLPAHQDEGNGTITDILPNSSFFVIADNNGQQKRFELEEDTIILINDIQAAPKDLNVGNRVHVIYHVDEAALVATEVRCNR